jgi:hypothetical protein
MANTVNLLFNRKNMHQLKAPSGAFFLHSATDSGYCCSAALQSICTAAVRLWLCASDVQRIHQTAFP